MERAEKINDCEQACVIRQGIVGQSYLRGLKGREEGPLHRVRLRFTYRNLSWHRLC